MKMLEVGSVVYHLNEFNMVTNKLSYVGVNFDDEFRDLIILFSFLERWNGLVMAVSNSVFGSNTLKFDDIFGVILSKETQRKSTSETSRNALTMESRGRKRERGKIPCNHNKYRKGRSNSILGEIEC